MVGAGGRVGVGSSSGGQSEGFLSREIMAWVPFWHKRDERKSEAPGFLAIHFGAVLIRFLLPRQHGLHREQKGEPEPEPPAGLWSCLGVYIPAWVRRGTGHLPGSKLGSPCLGQLRKGGWLDAECVKGQVSDAGPMELLLGCPLVSLRGVPRGQSSMPLGFVSESGCYAQTHPYMTFMSRNDLCILVLSWRSRGLQMFLQMTGWNLASFTSGDTP